MSNLSTKAMLVVLNQRAWTAKAIDHEIAAATEATYEAEQGTMRVIKELTPKEYVQPVYQIMWLGRKEHYRMTVHGLTHGQHLLSAAMVDRYTMIQLEIKESFYFAVDNFLSIYPDILAGAPARLNKAYKASDFPSEGQIKGYFEYRHSFLPVPNVTDWRLDNVDQKDVDNMRGAIEDEVRAMFNNATKEVFERAKGVLANIAAQAEDYKPGPGSGGGLRDAAIANLKEVSDLVMRMNVTGDPSLDQLGKEMVENFANLEAARLRKDEELRKTLSETANRLLKKYA